MSSSVDNSINISSLQQSTESLTIRTNPVSNFEESISIIAVSVGTYYTCFSVWLERCIGSDTSVKEGTTVQGDLIPTILLLNPEQSLNSFGREALENYEALSDDERDNYFYIKNFKIPAANPDKITQSTITEAGNKTVSLSEVLTLSLGYIHDLAMKAAKTEVPDLQEDSIQWNIVVPSVWTCSTKTLFRKAALKAGIPKDKLRLVLEPDAGSIFYNAWCKDPAVQEIVLPGNKYVLANLEQTRAEFNIFEVLLDNRLSCQGHYRDNSISYEKDSFNVAVTNFLADLFGRQVWEEFETRYPAAQHEIIYTIETNMAKISDSNKNHSSVTLPSSLMYLFKAQHGKSLSAVIKSRPYKKLVSFHKDSNTLTIKDDLLKQFYSSSLNAILKKLREIVKANTELEIKALLLVGRYAEPHFVKEVLGVQFPHLKVITQPCSRQAILKGALAMGYMPLNSIQRRAQYTYGFASIEPFDSQVHPEELKTEVDGESWCDWVFKKRIEIGQELNYGDSFIIQGYGSAVDPEWKYVDKHTSLWRSSKVDPRFCLYEDCEEVGLIVHRPPLDGWPYQWQHETKVTVGETELNVKYVNLSTGDEDETQIDFL